MPGILVAATGVGAGDLLTASLGGSAVGLTLLWAAVVGAILKWSLNEGLARWQMATQTTLLEGWADRLGSWVRWTFLAYLLVWTIFTGGALVNACGVAGTGLYPLGHNAHHSKIMWGVVHSLVGAILVLVGGFKLFEKLMAICIATMFVTVVATALLMNPNWAEVGRGITWPTIIPGGEPWILGVMGGVGGTVTLLSYGYWIREKGRTGRAGVRACRLDLGIGYTMTALFGLAMIIIGSQVELAGRGSSVAVTLADKLAEVLGPIGRWVFLAGFWGAVFSSLLGVWQGVPYLFADFLSLHKRKPNEERVRVDFTRTTGYRIYLGVLAIGSLPLLWGSVGQVMKVYAVFGSLFMPFLAVTLLILNNRTKWVGRAYRNGWASNLALASTFAFFAFVVGKKVWNSFGA